MAAWPSPDLRARREKRIQQIAFASRSYAYFVYSLRVQDFPSQSIEPPDPTDPDISIRQWKWLMREYHAKLRRFKDRVFLFERLVH